MREQGSGSADRSVPSVHEQVFGVAAPEVGTEFARVSGERVVAGLWDRGGLARRDRRLLTLAVLAAGPNDVALDAHLDGALAVGDLTPAELEEAAVHLAHYAGWPVGSRLALAAEAAVDRRRRAAAAAGPVGVVGVGALGGDVARELAANGVDVVVLDTRPEVAATVAGSIEEAATESPDRSLGRATVARTLADVVERCRVVSVVVRTDAQVVEVVDDLVAAGTPAGTTVLVHATVSVATVVEAAARADAAGFALLDVGLCRPAGLDSGFVAVVGGAAADVERVGPALAAVARHVEHVGPLGTGMVVKAARNATLYGAYASIAEATDVGRAAGIDEAALLRTLEVSGAAGAAGLAFITYRDDWLDGEGADVAQREGFVDLAVKDLGVARSSAGAVGVDARFADAVAAAMPATYVVDPPA
jgi:3-hydroxyisobutyrate dehydrogenase